MARPFGRYAPIGASLGVGSMAIALAFRELYGALFALAFIKSWIVNPRQRRWWLVASLLVSVFGALHVVRANSYVADSGYDASFGNEKMNIHFLLSAISPSDKPLGWSLA